MCYPRNSRQNWKLLLFALMWNHGCIFPMRRFPFQKSMFSYIFFSKETRSKAAEQSRHPINNSIFLQMKKSKTQNGRNGSKKSDSHKMLKFCFLFQNFHFLFSVFPSTNNLVQDTLKDHLGIGLALSCFGLGLCPRVPTGCLHPQWCSVYVGC